jgi:hypothetical protein
MGMLKQDRRRAFPPEDLHPMPPMLKNSGRKVSFVSKVQELTRPFLEMDCTENEVVQNRTDPDPDQRQTTHHDPSSGVLSREICGVLFQGLFQKSGILATGSR